MERLWLQSVAVSLYFLAIIGLLFGFSLFAHQLQKFLWTEAFLGALLLAIGISVIYFLDRACTALNLNYYVEGWSPRKGGV